MAAVSTAAASACRNCGAEFTHPNRRGPRAAYCSAQCRRCKTRALKRSRREIASPEQKAAESRKHRERYERRCLAEGRTPRKNAPSRPRRQVIETRACVHCATPFLATCRDKRYCTSECANLAQTKAWQRPCAHCRRPFTSRYTLSSKQRAAQFEQRYCSTDCSAAARGGRPPALPPKPRQCAACHQSYTPRHGFRSSYCSENCRSDMKRARRKAQRNIRRSAAADGEVVNDTRVFTRDGWRCQICGDRTPERLRGKGRPKSPTIDHRIPLSRGGTHTYENCQCACSECNFRKGARASTGQMTLFPNPVLTLKGRHVGLAHEQSRHP